MLEHGRQIGNFTIDTRISRGSTGEVYRAFQGSMKREVALKIVPVDERVSDRRDAYQRFEREADVIARLEHPHIVPLHGYGVWEDEFAYLAMRYMRGGTLSEFFKREGPLPPERAIHIFGQIALALDHAHRQGIVHRDIKPGNILLDELGNAYLTDFGLVKLMEMSLGWTETGTLVGTPLYASPEQIRDSDALDYRSDLYSFAVVVYHGLAGRPPFEMDDQGVMMLIRRQVAEQPPPPSRFNPALSPKIDAILLKALQKDPEQRYMSAGDMIRDLAAAADMPLPNTFESAPAPLPAPAEDRRLPHWLRWLAALIAVALVVTGVMTWWQERTAERVNTGYTLLRDRTGSPADTALTPNEIARARARLGEDGLIAYIACTMETEMTTFLARAMGDVAAEYGLRYEVFDSRMDAYAQANQIEEARRAGAVALVVCQLDARQLQPTLQSAAEGGVALAFNAPPLIDDGVIVMVDNEELGREIGREAGLYIQEQLGGQARVILLGLPESTSAQIITTATEAALLEAAPNVEIVGHYRATTRSEGRAVALTLLDAGTTFDVVLAVTDAAAMGVINELEAREYAPDSVAVFSINGESLARQYVRRGEFMRATVMFDRDSLARSTMQALIKMLGGGTLPRAIMIASSEVMRYPGALTTPADKRVHEQAAFFRLRDSREDRTGRFR